MAALAPPQPSIAAFSGLRATGAIGANVFVRTGQVTMRRPSYLACKSAADANLVNGAVTEGPSLASVVNGLSFPNPFVIGSGPPGTNYTVMKKAFDEGWGGVICKTVRETPYYP